ncbi:MAG TPA: tetratricopeptide repeat protein [Vicinamibacteria bacterium]|nr:tetratricopeptide repeat protein [Vicinamibacteria bacterium]
MPKPDTTASGHLDALEFHDLLEGTLPRGRKHEVEGHLSGCADCAETLAMILRADRPASKEEQAELSRIPESDPAEVVEKLRPAIAASASRRRSGTELRSLLAAAAVMVGLGAASWQIYTRSWLPAESRRIASETMAAMVELRQATGRIPLRYITEFERASVTRSGFDEEDPVGDELLAQLRTAVTRAPEKEAVVTLGLLLLDDGQLDEAESLFQQAIETDPNSVDALNGLAVVYYERAQRDSVNSYRLLQRGLAYLRQAQSKSPEDLRVLYNFGRYYEALEMRPAAIQAWTRYLDKDKASQWAEEAVYQLAQLVPR